MRNSLKPLAKSVLIPLGITAAASSTDTAIHKKMFQYGTTTLIISNEEMNDVMKTVKSIEESGILINGVSQTVKNEAIEQKGGFLGMLLGITGARLIGNLLTGKEAITTSQGRDTIRAGEGTIKADQNFQSPSSFNKFYNTKVVSKQT